ncbi:MAG: hypothetical protein KF718_33040 [Polyangiaceae bacterium]|nr:hypothetical protein [Polyangiaceae bacterium]
MARPRRVLCSGAANFLGTTAFRMAPTAAILAGIFIAFAFARVMISELNSVAGSKLVVWHWFIPVYGLYWAAVAVQREMATAKQRAGKGAARGAVLYLFLFLYALAADLNDLVE